MATLRDQPRTYTQALVLSPGARCYFYLSGTLTPTPVYAAPGLRVDPSNPSAILFDFKTKHPNPLRSDIAARLPPIYLNQAVTYRMRMLDADGNLLHDIDPFTFFEGPAYITPRDDGGERMPGATITVYLSRTHEALATYTADATGMFADITLDNFTTYRVVLKKADGTLVYDVDPYPGNGLSIAGGGQPAAFAMLIAGRVTPSSAAIMTSADGVNWTVRATPATGGIRGICFSPELRRVVAVGGTGPSTYVMTSDDGITWTPRTSIGGQQWLDVCWSPQLSLFVAICDFATDNVFTSPDGITWTAVPGTPNRTWTCIAWLASAGLFAAGAISGSGVGNLEAVMTSPDGVNWTLRNAPDQAGTQGYRFYRMAVGPNYFIGASRDNFGVSKSFDGITWTFIPTGLGGSAYGDLDVGEGVVAMSRPTNEANARSLNNGTTWANTNVSGGAEAVIYSPELAMFVGAGGGARASGSRCSYSLDGLTWSNGVTPNPADTPGDWNCVCAAFLPLP